MSSSNAKLTITYQVTTTIPLTEKQKVDALNAQMMIKHRYNLRLKKVNAPF